MIFKEKIIHDYISDLDIISVEGSGSGKFCRVDSIFEATQNSITWINPNRKDKAALFEKSKAGIIICPDEKVFTPKKNQILIRCSNPKLIFAQILISVQSSQSIPEIHNTAVIHSEAKIGNNVAIGPNVVIGKCTIGDDTTIGANSIIEDNCLLGKRVVVKPSAVIGGDGYGYVKHEAQQLKFPHTGGVLIEDDVHIGSQTCIDRGSLGFTKIGRHTKIDNLVHIAHNVIIGENCNIIALSIIGGSTVIGNNTWISPSVSVRDAITIGSNSLIGIGSIVTKSVPDNQIWFGNPAKYYKNKNH
ncbi:MAG: UDP-3-O-(3-hydroxymyristoyl)glucosamine N-acyltransferase [Flavobacteriaceae bacterium]